MDKDQQDSTLDKSDNIVIPASSTTEYVDEPITDIPKSDISQSNRDKNNEPIQFTVNIPKEESQAAVIANKIALFGLIINLVLAYFTYRLYQKTVEANKTSQYALGESTRANDISSQALADSRKADSVSDIKDSISFMLTKSQFETSRKKDSVITLLTKQSVNAQINSLKETQNQFFLENLAYIECTDFSFKTFEADKEPRIVFKISNVGKVPVKVTKFRLGFFHSPTVGFNPEGYLSTISYDPFPTSFYITKESPSIQYFRAFDKISKNVFEILKNDGVYMFFCGEILYTNEINNKKMKYIFNALLSAPPSNEYRVVYLSNEEVK